MGLLYSRMCSGDVDGSQPMSMRMFFSTLCRTRGTPTNTPPQGKRKVVIKAKKKKNKKKRFLSNKTISEQKVIPKMVSPLEVGLGDINMALSDEDNEEAKNVAKYCLPLIVVHFCGMTSTLDDEDTDNTTKEQRDHLTLRDYLRMMDRFLRQADLVTDITGEEDEFKLLLNLIAVKRHRKGLETVEDCYERLLEDSKRFVEIYHERGVPSEACAHKCYWGSRQQLLSGKVIADHIDPENGSLDPIFGVLLQPTAGRVGPGDTGVIHNVLFDNTGHMAFHAAVHDAFGYLKTVHDKGPGYDYLHGSTFFATHNCMAGQIPGINFWKKAMADIATKEKVLEHWRC